MTDRLSGGKVGYVHVQGMNDESFRNTFDEVLGKNMNKEMKDVKSDDSPKFGRLLIILFLTVLFLGFLTWLMETQFSDFGW